MWDRVDRLGVLLIDAGVSGAALLAVVALAMVVTRQPARRLRLARAGVLGLLALIPLEALGLVPRVDLSAVSRNAAITSHPVPGRKWSAIEVPVARPPALLAGHPPRDLGMVPRLPLEQVSRGLVLAYSAGIAGGFAWLTLGYLGLAWLARRSTSASPGTQAFYMTLPTDREGRRPRLLVSDRARGPVIVGFPRSSIVIPPDLDPPEPTAATFSRLRLALLHELAHAEAGDAWFSLAGQIAQAYWFVLPPIWWVAAQMRLDQEFLADRRAAVGFGPLHDYAASLLEFASDRASASPLVAVAVDSENDLTPGHSHLFQRVLMLTRCPFPVEPRPPAWWSWCLPCFAVMCTLGASSLSLHPNRALDPQPTVVGKAPDAPPGRTFHVARLELPAKIAERGRSPIFELPVPLPPDHFELNIDVWADPSTLARIRVVGLPLGTPGPFADRTSASPAWHHVRVVRDQRRHLSLQVDDRPVTIDPDQTGLTNWLAVEPASGCEGRFQSLTLTW